MTLRYSPSRSISTLAVVAAASTGLLLLIWFKDSELFDDLSFGVQAIYAIVAAIIAAASSGSCVLLSIRIIQWLRSGRLWRSDDFPPSDGIDSGPATPRWPAPDGTHCGVPIPPHIPSPLQAHASATITAD